MKKYWIISAHKKEIPGIEKILMDHPDFLYFQCGIGLFESFYNFNTLVNSVSQIPEAELLAGSAGSPRFEDILTIILSNDFVNPQFRFEELPEFLPHRWKTLEPAAGIKPGNYNKAPVYSTFGISSSTEHLNDSMTGAWENMEALSLSYICMKKQIPFLALLCCTNEIGQDGRKGWKENYQRAGEILAEEIRKLLESDDELNRKGGKDFFSLPL